MEIGGITSDIVALALDAALMQHRAISQNLANANSHGYRRTLINFDDIFKSVSEAQDDNSARIVLSEASERLHAGMETQYSGQVKIEQEMAIMAKNTLYYQALLTGIGKRSATLKLAITEGR